MKIICGILVLFLTSCEHAKSSEVVFDISSLMGLNIDQIRKTLAADLDSEGIQKTDVYKKKGIVLYVDFDLKSREVTQFQLVSTNKDFEKFGDILKIGNLDSINPAYSLETNQSWDYGKYSNVTVYPKQ